MFSRGYVLSIEKVRTAALFMADSLKAGGKTFSRLLTNSVWIAIVTHSNPSSLVGPPDTNSLKFPYSVALMFRPFLFGILCCMAALGHAPAWLHVYHCGGEICGGQVAATETGCADGCQHHADAAPPDATEEDGHSHDDHDEDTCSICQSLSAPCGVTWTLDDGDAEQLPTLPAIQLTRDILVGEFEFVAAPRGPPLFV